MNLYVRFLIAGFIACGAGIIQSTRMDFYITYLALIKNNPNNNSDTITKTGLYDMDEEHIGILLSATFIGSGISSFFLSTTPDSDSSKIMRTSIIFNSLLNCIIPYLINHGYWGVVYLRTVMGFLTAPGLLAQWFLISRYTPAEEFQFMLNLVFLFKTLITGALLEVKLWEYIFYIEAFFGVVWVLASIYIITDNPEDNILISEQENVHIQEHASIRIAAFRNIGLRNVFTSLKTWAGIVSFLCCNWMRYFLLMEIPYFYRQIYNLNTTKIATYYALPLIGQMFLYLFFCFLFKQIRSYKFIEKVQILVNFSSIIIPMFSCLELWINHYNLLSVDVLLITIAGTLIGGIHNLHTSNFNVIPPDISIIILHVLQLFTSIVGVIEPIYSGYILADYANPWDMLFGTTFFICIIALFANIVLTAVKGFLEFTVNLI